MHFMGVGYLQSEWVKCWPSQCLNKRCDNSVLKCTSYLSLFNIWKAGIPSSINAIAMEDSTGRARKARISIAVEKTIKSAGKRGYPGIFNTDCFFILSLNIPTTASMGKIPSEKLRKVMIWSKVPDNT